VIGLVVGVISGVWQGSIMFGVVLFLAQFLSVLSAAVTGALAPVMAKWSGFDPAAFAGPMETAMQDIVGNAVFLSLAAGLLKSVGM